ncbi:IS66 family insertion sequence element accessory protein TnpB [Anaeromicropila populeti]|uniref:IS66 Orf2 like protein n=1 Tax=Anaeromicropila populeti TaxID=37658 RepID=A0A1I6JGB0_9FIRM|nr:IS66 family insertion sequence element accessory protein TnpB [Anaeromicropila populeti]SFR78003.1 IS66 Orf2 like protein [Anaeromicropila populeti]
MLNRLVTDTKHIYLALGATDFRKQISSLVSLVQLQFEMDPFLESSIFIFCNKKRDSIKLLRYDKNGFILAHKKLLEKMKFQWPKDSEMVKEITSKQVEWLLEGLEIEQKKAHHEVKINIHNACF